MAITGQYNLHSGTAAEFKAAVEGGTIVAADLYFLTDTKEIYVGAEKYCNPVAIVANATALPAEGVAGVLYIAEDDKSIKVWDGAAYKVVVPATVAAIADDTDAAALANVGAIKAFVNSKVAAVGNPISAVDYDEATQKITFTYLDETTKEVALKELVTDVEYDAATGNMTFSKANGEAKVINTPVENFLQTATYDADANTLTLKLVDGTEFPVDLNDLVDTYTVADTDTVDMEMTAEGEISANVKISAAEGNAIVAKTGEEAGLFVAIPKDYIQSIEDTATIDLEVDAAGKLTAVAKISAEADNQIVAKEDGLFVAKTDLSNYYTKAEEDAAHALKADKTEVNAALELKANAADVYTKTEADELLAAKADKATTYTKDEVDAALALKANAADVYTKSEVYTKAEVDALGEWKAI